MLRTAMLRRCNTLSRNLHPKGVSPAPKRSWSRDSTRWISHTWRQGRPSFKARRGPTRAVWSLPRRRRGRRAVLFRHQTGSGVGQHAAREVRTNIPRVPFDVAPELWTPYRSSCGASAEITPGPRESGLFSGFYPRTFGTPISFSSDLNSDRCSAVRGRAGRRPGPPLRPIHS